MYIISFLDNHVSPTQILTPLPPTFEVQILTSSPLQPKFSIFRQNFSFYMGKKGFSWFLTPTPHLQQFLPSPQPPDYMYASECVQRSAIQLYDMMKTIGVTLDEAAPPPSTLLKKILY